MSAGGWARFETLEDALARNGNPEMGSQLAWTASAHGGTTFRRAAVAQPQYEEVSELTAAWPRRAHR